MLSKKLDLLTFLLISATVFSSPSIAADQDHTLPESQTLTGQLEILIADNFETGVSQRRYAIRIKQADGGSRLVSLSFASIPPDSTLKSGEQVTVGGRLIGNTMDIDSLQRVPIDPSDEIIRTAEVSRSALSIGDRHAVVLIIDMKDRRGDTDPGNDIDYKNPYEVSDLIQLMYTGDQNVKDLYDASSFGQLNFVPDTDGDEGPDVFGPYTIEFNSDEAECSMDSWGFESVIQKWATAADVAATSQGKDLTQYQHRIYFLPNEVNCGWVGMGTVNCPDEYIDEQNLCRAWIVKSNSHSNEGPYIAHELGHNIGWDHSSVDLNNDGIIANVDLNGNNKIDEDEDEEYGDRSGIMGIPKWAQANAPHRDQNRWFDAYPDSLVTTACSNTFELHALELDPSDNTVGTQVVKVPIPNTSEYYYISYRRHIGTYPSYTDYADKINIHRHDGNMSNTTLVANLEQNGIFEDAANGITITADSAGGAIATAVVEIANSAPNVDFSYTPTDGHLNVQFENASSDDQNNIASYQWEIDGQTLTGESPTYTFSAGGTYSVTLSVTDDCGSTGDRTKDVIVVANTAPTANFTLEKTHLDVQFTDASTDDDGTIVSWQWDFGDGSSPASDTSNPNHTYAESGTYEAKLIVTDDDGATHEISKSVEVVANQPPEANFTSSANGLDLQFTDTSTDSDGNIVSRQWKFLDDRSVSDLANPSHTYASAGSYKVQLTVTDDDGNSDTEVKDITVSMNNVPPTADFTLQADRLSVVFTDTSTDSDGTIASHLWDFGDNVTSIEASPNHTYAAAGTYIVVLTVTDNHGATGTESKSITVDVNNVPPVAAFTFTADGLDIQFSDTSTDSDGTVASHQWDFGDGSVSTETSPIHTFTTAGTYAVALTVTDNDGETHTFTENVEVDQINPLVVPGNPGGGGGGGGGCFINDLF
jgi:PKD repeat protein